MDTEAVTVTVTNVEELGTLSGDSIPNYEEGGEGAVGTYTASGGSMSMVANWSLMGDDMGDLSISTSGVLTFDATPNYEMPMDEDMDNTYKVTVMAEAGGEMDEIMVTVTVDQRGRAGYGNPDADDSQRWHGDNRNPDRPGHDGNRHNLAVVQVHDHGRNLHGHRHGNLDDLHPGGR